MKRRRSAEAPTPPPLPFPAGGREGALRSLERTRLIPAALLSSPLRGGVGGGVKRGDRRRWRQHPHPCPSPQGGGEERCDRLNVRASYPPPCSPPPCGEELEVGVRHGDRRRGRQHPHPCPSPQGGGEERCVRSGDFASYPPPCSPPPCGEELEVGVRHGRSAAGAPTPPPLPLPTRGRGGALRAFGRLRLIPAALLSSPLRGGVGGRGETRRSTAGAPTPPPLPFPARGRGRSVAIAVNVRASYPPPCSPPPCGEELEAGV